jgi:uncharacterized protein (TIGR03790 family)
MMPARRLLWVPLLLAPFVGSRAPAAITPANVLVLYNSASPDGLAIANHDASVHPGVQVLGLDGVSTAESITADDYLNTIRPQVLPALTPSTEVIVTTKGLPLRIHVTQPQPPAVWPNPSRYTDPWGVQHTIVSWKEYSSLESELANIDRVASWEMMGDQSYTANQGTHFAANPYYNSGASFSHATTNTRLTSRLDGFTVEDVNLAVNRAQNAFIGPTNSPGGPLHFLADNDPSQSYSTIMANLVNNVLNPAGLPVTYDNTGAFVSSTGGPLMAYVGHGGNQASTPNYVPGVGSYVVHGLDIVPADGAVFHTWESFNAKSFVPGANYGKQSLVGEWLAIGGTAATGTVEEPQASWATVANDNLIFQALLSGKTWAEAAWGATKQLGYVNTAVGDPLMTWKQLLAGDVTRDGVVDMLDLAMLGANWGSTLTSGGDGWTSGDLNSDGVVDVLDLALLGSTWGQTSSWAEGQALMADSFVDFPFAALIETSMPLVPEPSSATLMTLAGVSLGGCAAYRRRKRARLIARTSASAL